MEHYKNLNAIVLAGGKGSRLMPLTKLTPKPMLEIAGRPILDYVVSQLKFYGISEVVFSLGYKWQKLASSIKNLEGIKPIISVENAPLGTLGAVKKASEFLSENFVVISGDCLSDINLADLISSHEKSGASVTMAVTPVSDPRLYGVLSLSDDGVITDFHEKPEDDRFGRLINCGVYVVNKRVLDLFPENHPCDFSLDLFPRLVSKREIYGFRHDGYWSDVGDTLSYYNANLYFMKRTFYPMINRISDYPMLDDGSNYISQRSRVLGKISSSVVCNGGVVCKNANLNACVVLPNSRVMGSHTRCIIQGNTVVPV